MNTTTSTRGVYHAAHVKAVARALQTDDAAHYAADAAHMLEDYAAALSAQTTRGVSEAHLREWAERHGLDGWSLTDLRCAFEDATSMEVTIPTASWRVAGHTPEDARRYAKHLREIHCAHVQGWGVMADMLDAYAAAPPAQPADAVIDFAGKGVAGPFPIKDGLIELPQVTLDDLRDRIADTAQPAEQEPIARIDFTSRPVRLVWFRLLPGKARQIDVYEHAVQPAERVPEGWVPISSAPCDGTMHVRGLAGFTSRFYEPEWFKAQQAAR